MSSNYPPGVTGNEPQITGEWPCEECDGLGYDEDEDGKHACIMCEGKGYITGDEKWFERAYYCKECKRPTVMYSDSLDCFVCKNEMCADEDGPATYTYRETLYELREDTNV